MIGLILVSHGDLARSLLETACEIVGPIQPAETLAVSRHETVADVRTRIQNALEMVDQGDGVLILADMFGGTAANVALQLVGQCRIEIVTGMNLPMLLKLSSVQETATDVTSLAQLLKFYGQKHVLVASELLKEREQDA